MTNENDNNLLFDKLSEKGCLLDTKIGFLEGFFSSLNMFLMPERKITFNGSGANDLNISVEDLSGSYVALKEKYGDEIVKGFGNISEICDIRKEILDGFKPNTVKNNN